MSIRCRAAVNAPLAAKTTSPKYMKAMIVAPSGSMGGGMGGPPGTCSHQAADKVGRGHLQPHIRRRCTKRFIERHPTPRRTIARDEFVNSITPPNFVD
jgi:hypothetical protein